MPKYSVEITERAVYRVTLEAENRRHAEVAALIQHTDLSSAQRDKTLVAIEDRDAQAVQVP